MSSMQHEPYGSIGSYDDQMAAFHIGDSTARGDTRLNAAGEDISLPETVSVLACAAYVGALRMSDAATRIVAKALDGGRDIPHVTGSFNRFQQYLEDRGSSINSLAKGVIPPLVPGCILLGWAASVAWKNRET